MHTTRFCQPLSGIIKHKRLESQIRKDLNRIGYDWSLTNVVNNECNAILEWNFRWFWEVVNWCYFFTSNFFGIILCAFQIIFLIFYTSITVLFFDKSLLNSRTSSTGYGTVTKLSLWNSKSLCISFFNSMGWYIDKFTACIFLCFFFSLLDCVKQTCNVWRQYHINMQNRSGADRQSWMPGSSMVRWSQRQTIALQ